MDRRTATVVAVVLALALVAIAGLAVVRTGQVRTLQAEQEELREKLAFAEDRLAQLEEQGRDPAGEAAPALPEGMEDLFGDGLGELGDMLDDLLGGSGGGDMGDLGGLAACVSTQDRIEVDDSTAEEQFDDIEDGVETLRGLDFTTDVEPAYLTQQEIGARIATSVEEEYSEEEADIDRRYLAALGAAPPQLDLRAAQKELLSGQVAGFYDSDTGEMVVSAENRGEPLGPTDQVTLAHELTHALADQQLGLPEVLDEELPDTDAALAALSLVEGDATLLMQRYAVAALEPGEQLGLAMDPRGAEAQQQLEQFPHILQRQLLFPYEEGLRFACAIHAAGGWEAVDNAYNELPVTTAEILFPDRYGQPAPERPASPAAPGESWTEARTDTMGAAELMWLFSAPGDDPEAALDDPRGRVGRWDGGVSTIWTDGDDTALGIRLRDRGGDGPSLCDSVTAWYEEAFDDDSPAATEGDERLALDGGYQAGVVTCSDDEVTLGTAPDLATARQIGG